MNTCVHFFSLGVSPFGDILWLLIENITVTSSCFRISIIPNLLRFHFFFFCFQAQLRAFIPEMLKYSTGRGKPGWGKESCKPIWWPDDIPWANVRSDVRTEEQKQRVKCLPIIELYCSKNWNLLDDTVQHSTTLPTQPRSSLLFLFVVLIVQYKTQAWIFKDLVVYKLLPSGDWILAKLCWACLLGGHL